MRALRRGWAALALAALFAVELWRSGVRVARLVLRPRLALRPALIAYPLGVTSDAEITLLANLITLTPGTLSVDVSDDRRLLFIHVLDLADRAAAERAIREGFEARIRRVFQ